MSGKAASHVLDVPFTEEDRPALLVALALSTYADDRGRSIWPAVDTIAGKVHYHSRHVRRIIDRLRDPDDLNVLELVRGSNRYRPNEYRLVVHSEQCRLLFGDECLGPLRQGGHPDVRSDDQGGHPDVTQGGHSHVTQGGHPDVNRFSIDSSENPQEESSSSKIRCSDGHEFVQIGRDRACKWCRKTQRSEKAKVENLIEGIAS